MSRFYIIIFLIFIQNSKAVILSDCGTYKLRGLFEMDKVSPVESKFIILMGTQSQNNLKFKSIEEFAKIDAYSGKFIELEVEILNQDDLNNKVMTKILTVKKGLPDPLQMHKDVIQLEKKICE